MNLSTNDTILVILIPILLGWGFGSLISNISKIRGRNKKYIFWVSFFAYSILLFVLVVGSLTYTISVSDNSIWAILIVGILATITNVLLVKTNWLKPLLIPKSAKSDKQPISNPPKSTEISSGNIFISYRRSESADVSGRIYDRLIGKFGKASVFKDVDSIPLGIDFKDYLDKQVSECNVLLAIIGNSWVDAADTSGRRRLDDPTDFVRIELESALNRGIPVIPLLVHGAHMPHEENLPAPLQKLVYRNGIQIRHDPDFHHDMDRLIAALEKNFS